MQSETWLHLHNYLPSGKFGGRNMTFPPSVNTHMSTNPPQGSPGSQRAKLKCLTLVTCHSPGFRISTGSCAWSLLHLELGSLLSAVQDVQAHQVATHIPNHSPSQTIRPQSTFPPFSYLCKAFGQQNTKVASRIGLCLHSMCPGWNLYLMSSQL